MHRHATPAEEGARECQGQGHALNWTHRLLDHGNEVVKYVWLLWLPQPCSKLLDLFDT